MGVIAVPGIIAEFLEQRACVGFAAVRDAALRPSLHWVSAWALSADRRELRLAISRGYAPGLAEALAHNGELAATFEQIGPHETYQFKGKAGAPSPAGEADRALWELLRARFAVAVRRFDPGTPTTDAQLRDYIPPPELALTLSVREVFLQTPGPGAGRRLAPAEGP
jgi:hypothetical protein